MENNMQPLKPDNWPDELDQIRSFLGKPLNIHNMMAHHPQLLEAWMPLRNHVVNSSTLSGRHRELVILRTAHNCQADYEWQHHAARGQQAGLSMVEIQRVIEGAQAVDWNPEESTLLTAADDCHRDIRFSEKILKQMTQHFSSQQQLDLMVTVGMYKTLAMIIKTWDVPMED
jgi:4-carboxymuconolactone decarboxylase